MQSWWSVVAGSGGVWKVGKGREGIKAHTSATKLGSDQIYGDGCAASSSAAPVPRLLTRPLCRPLLQHAAACCSMPCSTVKVSDRLPVLLRCGSCIYFHACEISPPIDWSGLGNVRARRVCIALESQVTQKKAPEQNVHEDQTREIEERWCDGIGSAEQMQAKVLKRQEAAAKRERAMAYALTHQRQAASRKQKAATLQGVELDENKWGRNWLERWMAVRLWENRLLDSNAKEIVPAGESKQAEENEAKNVSKSKGKVPVSSIHSNGSSQKKGAKHKKSYSDVSGSSSVQFATVLPATSLGSSKLKPKSPDENFEEVSSQSSNRVPRSTSNPKERPAQASAPAKKRLYLPNKATTGSGVGKGRTNSIQATQPISFKNTAKVTSKSEPKHRPNRASITMKRVQAQA